VKAVEEVLVETAAPVEVVAQEAAVVDAKEAKTAKAGKRR